MKPKKIIKQKQNNKLLFITLTVSVILPTVLGLLYFYKKEIFNVQESISISSPKVWCYLHMVFITCSLLFYAYLIFLQRGRWRLSFSAKQYELDPNLTPGQVYWMINNDYNEKAYLSDLLFQKTASKQHVSVEAFTSAKENLLKQTKELYNDHTMLMNLLSFGIVFFCNSPYITITDTGFGIIGYFFSSALFVVSSLVFLRIIKLFKIKGFNSKGQVQGANGFFSLTFLLIIFFAFNCSFLFFMTKGTDLFAYNFSFFILLAFFFAYSSTKDYHFLNIRGKKLKKDVENILSYMQQSPKSPNGRYQLYPHLIPFAIAFGFKGYELEREEEINFILNRIFYEKTDAEINLIKENIENMYKD